MSSPVARAHNRSAKVRTLPLLAVLPAVLVGCATSSGVASAPGATSSPGAANVRDVEAGPVASASLPDDGGVVVMAHGGSAEWNAAVSEAVGPLRERLPVAVAFGMADPTTLQAALDSVTARGALRIAVVRLFLSGGSFLHQTEYLLGLRPDAPERPLLMRHGGEHGDSHGGEVEFGPLRIEPPVVLQRPGLSDHDLSWRIAVERAVELGREPAQESVLFLAHGVGDEDENDALLERMEGAVEAVRARGFHDAAAFTLREDWPEARAKAEKEIRAWVSARREAGDRVLVVPYRLSGFGPYASVLEGMEYEEGRGLLPHPLVARFVEQTAAELLAR